MSQSMLATLSIATLTTRPLESRDVAPMQSLFDEDPEYFLGMNAREIPVEEIRAALPPGRSRDDKFLYAFERDGRLAGMIDLIRGYPEPHIWFLGFLFIAKEFRGRGIGRCALHALYDHVRAHGGTVLRLGVVEKNDRARWLYATEGFVFEAVREIDPAANRSARTLVLRRAL
jgi:RimJ/RimL family protein N-acetyltransferase